MTKEDYLRGVAAIIRANQKPGEGVKASTLGNLVLSGLNQRWTEHGYPTLKPLLQELERANEVRLIYGGPGKLSVETLAEPAAQRAPVPESARRRRLRAEVWEAFVNELPVGVRAMHRETGEVRIGLKTLPPSDAKWLQIERIPDDTFKNLARSVIEQENIPSRLREVLGDPIWFAKLSLEMKRVAPWVVPVWSRLRTQFVLDHVERWCTLVKVPMSLVLESQPLLQTAKALVRAVDKPGEEAVRERILAALAMMTLDELLEIPIKGKYTMRDALR